MNCEICHLKELEVEVFQVREVLRCILHTILFHRALGLVRPKDVDSEHFEITYVQCGDAELEKKIEERIDHFYGWVEKHPNKKGQVLLSFYEVKNKQASWFTNKVERLYWEQWYITLHIVQPNMHSRSNNTKAALDPAGTKKGESSSRHASLETSLREVLFQIIKFVNEKKDHIPPVPNLDCVSFPYEITVPRFAFLYPFYGVMLAAQPLWCCALYYRDLSHRSQVNQWEKVVQQALLFVIYFSLSGSRITQLTFSFSS